MKALSLVTKGFISSGIKEVLIPVEIITIDIIVDPVVIVIDVEDGINITLDVEEININVKIDCDN